MELEDEVATGRAGMLFHRFDGAFAQLCAEGALEDGWREAWRARLIADSAHCASLGARFIPFVVPERHTVCHELLPDGSQLDPQRPIRQLQRALAGQERALLFYPDAAMRAASHFARLFHLTDQHMSDAGAYTCYRAFLDRHPDLSPRPPIGRDELVATTSRMLGDLGVRRDDVADEDVEHLRPACMAAAKIASISSVRAGRVDVYEQADTSLPRAVWFGDSHSFSLLPFFAEHFSRLVAVQTTHYLADLVELETPDVVISQFSETSLVSPRGLHTILGGEADRRTPDLVALHAAGGLSRADATFISVTFGTDGNSDAYCEFGWSPSEARHRWTDGTDSALVLPLPPRRGTPWRLRLDVSPFIVPTRLESQRLIVSNGGDEFGRFDVRGEMSVEIPLDPDRITPLADRPDHWRLDLSHPDAASPADFGGTDPRRLAQCIMRLRIDA